MKLVRFQYENFELQGSIISKDNSLYVSNDKIEVPLEKAFLLTPVLPSKIVGIGLNYLDHAEELKIPQPDEPAIFIKPGTSVIGPNECIIYPEMAKQVDYEAELAVVIKDRINNICEKEVYNHILGYTCFNDVTARDLQKKDVQWTRAKSFDTFSPIGPFIETDIDPAELSVKSTLNGELRQSSNTSEMIFKIPFLVSYVSKIMTLLPGDVITTGTPPGIGPMFPGDSISIEIDGLGKLTNLVKLNN